MQLTPDLIEYFRREYPEHVEMLTAEPTLGPKVLTAELAENTQNYFGARYDDGKDTSTIQEERADLLQFAIQERIPWIVAFRAFLCHRINRRAQAKRETA